MEEQKNQAPANGQSPEELAAQQLKAQQKDMAKEMAKSTAKQELNRAVSRALPDEVNQLRWAGARAIPVIGPIIQWLDNIAWVRNLFGGGKK